MAVILITGAARGVGFHLAELLASKEHTVIATYRRVNDALRELTHRYPTVTLLPMDVTREESVRTAAAMVGMKFGQLDAIVSNAGISVERAKQVSIFALRDDDLRDMLEVNVIGAARVIRLMDALVRDGGMFLTVTSEAGSIDNAFDIMPGYAISKAAENKLVTVQRAATKRYTVRAVHPGQVDTDMGHDSAQITPAESVRGIAALLLGETPIPSGEWFVDYQGKPMAH